jgi:hypothetical protein
MRASHITVAAESGMKAGLRAYMASLAVSGLPQVAEAHGELLDMSSNERFKFYCNKFGRKVEDARGVDVKAAPRSRMQRENVVQTGAEAEIAELEARIAELRAPKPAKAERKSTKATKENLWRPWAIAKHNIPTQVGATFTYKGKRRTSTFKVTRVTADGVYSVRAA